MLVAAAMVGALSTPVRACTDPRAYAYDPKKPFSEHYFQSAETVFRGRPIEFRDSDASASANSFAGAEITFEVLETLLGRGSERWTALWVNTMDLAPGSLQAFKDEVGDDLVVILEGPNEKTSLLTELPVIRFGLLCTPAAMGRFAVMESILRQRGLID